MEQRIQRLQEIREELSNLTNEAKTLLPADGMIRQRAELGWLARLELAVQDDAVTRHTTTLSRTIQELETAEMRKEIAK